MKSEQRSPDPYWHGTRQNYSPQGPMYKRSNRIGNSSSLNSQLTAAEVYKTPQHKSASLKQ